MDRPALILIASAQPHLLLTLQHLLRQVPGVQVRTTDQALPAVHQALEQRPDLLLLEVNMPDLDGYTACRMIRQGWASEPAHAGKIWFIASRSTHAERDQAANVGADGWIVEPPDPDFVARLAQEVVRAKAAESPGRAEG